MKPLNGKKIATLLIFVLVIMLLAYRLFWYRHSIAVTLVRKAEIQRLVQGPGTVQSRVPVAVGAKITGILVKLYADQGERVKKGQLLAELDSDQLRAQMAGARAAKNRAEQTLSGARADLLKSQANLELTQSNYRRYSELLKNGIISQAVFDTTEAALKVAESNVTVSEHAIAAAEAEFQEADFRERAAEAEFAYTRIFAPMDGLVTSRTTEVGDTISPGLPIFQMVDYQVWSATWIDETKLAELREGQKASIRLRSGRVFQGEVVRINKEADIVTRELEVDVKFDSLPEPLVIGEETEVEIQTGTQTAPVAPLSAITQQKGSKGVFLVSDALVSFRPVSTGFENGGKVAIIDGLKEGDMVIINPAGIKPGNYVKPELEASAS